jgi:hypothetical protein
MELLPFGSKGREGSQFGREEGDHATAIEGEAKILLRVRRGWEGEGQVNVWGDGAALGDIEETSCG